MDSLVLFVGYVLNNILHMCVLCNIY